jgi:hypothetical protein
MAVVGGPPGDISALFRLERGRLLDLLKSLAPTDWSRDTPCPGWKVLGLVSHLVNGDLGVLSRNRDHYLGTRPPDGADESEFIEWLDELMKEWVSATRGLSPKVAIGLLSWSGPQIVEHFAAQDQMARTAHIQWAGPEPCPVWLNQVRELSEFGFIVSSFSVPLTESLTCEVTFSDPFSTVCAGPIRTASPARSDRAETP